MLEASEELKLPRYRMYCIFSEVIKLRGSEKLQICISFVLFEAFAVISKEAPKETLEEGDIGRQLIEILMTNLRNFDVYKFF